MRDLYRVIPTMTSLGFGRAVCRVTVLMAAALPMAFGCTTGVDSLFPEVPAPTIEITVLSGDNQNVTAGSEFPQPVVARVRRDGVLLANSAISFTLTQSAPPAISSSRLSDAAGVVSIRPTAAAALGAFTLKIFYLHCSRPGLEQCESPYTELGAVSVHGTVVAP
jgi:hypothetical protein